MKEEVFRKIEKHLIEHKKMSLSTVSPDGQAMAHTVQYASKGNTVYFFTKPTQRKVVNINNNPGVAYTVDHDYEDWSKIQGAQMIGNARVLDDAKEIDAAFALITKKFPHMAAIGKAFLEHHVIVEVSPALGRFIDNTVSFLNYEETGY